MGLQKDIDTLWADLHLLHAPSYEAGERIIALLEPLAGLTEEERAYLLTEAEEMAEYADGGMEAYRASAWRKLARLLTAKEDIC